MTQHFTCPCGTGRTFPSPQTATPSCPRCGKPMRPGMAGVRVEELGDDCLPPAVALRELGLEAVPAKGRPRRGPPAPPSVHAERGRVEVLTPDQPGPAVSVTEEEACRRLLTWEGLLSACEEAFNLIDGAECPVDDPQEWKAGVWSRLRGIIAVARAPFPGEGHRP